MPLRGGAARDSQVWPCGHAAAAVAGSPLGRSVGLEDCGHAADHDRPEEFNAVLPEFLHEL